MISLGWFLLILSTNLVVVVVHSEVDNIETLLLKDCEINGKIYKHNTRFEMDCMGWCHCRHGNVGCVSLCPPFIVPDGCRKVKPLGQCCRKGMCPDELSECVKEKTKKNPEMTMTANFSPPWVVQLTTSVGGHKNTCTATMMNYRTLYTSSHCVTDDSKILFPSVDWTIAAVRHNQPANQISTVELRRPINTLRTMHEINTPWAGTCAALNQRTAANNQCALFLSSYDPVANKSKSVAARPVDNRNCNINPVDYGAKCLEIKAYPGCPNLDGSSVAVKLGDSYYMVGILADGPSDKDPRDGCDINRSRFRKYRDLCDRLKNVQDFDNN